MIENSLLLCSNQFHFRFIFKCHTYYKILIYIWLANKENLNFRLTTSRQLNSMHSVLLLTPWRLSPLPWPRTVAWMPSRSLQKSRYTLNLKPVSQRQKLRRQEINWVSKLWVFFMSKYIVYIKLLNLILKYVLTF